MKNKSTKDSHHKPFFKRRKVRIWLIIVGILVIIRLFLPYFVLQYCNKVLANMDGYYGEIKDIDISLYRGAYEINDIYIDKKDSATGKQTPFFRAKNIDLSVEWSALFKGALVGELVFNQAALHFTQDKTELSDVKKDTNDFRKLLKDFMPLKINRFEVNNSTLQYLDHGSNPKVDIALSNLHILALNLKNVADSNSLLPATIQAQGDAYEGHVDINLKLDPLAENATFDLDAEIENVNLAMLNDFLKAYGGFDVTKGNFGLFSELAAKDGKFKGYVKPLIKDLKVVGPEDRNDAFFSKLWEAVVGVVGEVFENQKKDQLASRIPLSGSFNNPRPNILEAIWEVLQNAFIQALMPSVDHEININSVSEDKEGKRNIFQKIFGGKKDGKDDKEDKKNKRKNK